MSEKQKKWINGILIAGIFIVVTVFYLRNPADRVTLRVEDGVLTAEGTESYSFQMPLEQIGRLELEENAVYPDTGTDSSVLCGSFSDETRGEYELCVYADVPACMTAYTPDGTYVFNCENVDTTQSFYEALLELIE